MIDNDEPIWVDKTDSLNVINWTLKNIVFNEKLTNCIYETKFDSQFNYNDENIIADSLDIVSCYDIQQRYLDKYILKTVYNKVYNIDNKLYTDLYEVNAIINIVNSSITNAYFSKNDSVNKILLYLNLYHKYKQIYYQEAYLKSSISIEDIKNNINKSCFLNDENKKRMYYENIFSKYYYKLNEFIISERLNNHYSNDDMIHDLIDKLIKNNISN